jgi:hypothetical protein
MSQTRVTTAMALEESTGLPPRIDTRWTLRELLDMAFFFTSCWVILGLLLVLAVLVGHAWLLLLGLVAGTATGLYPALLYRRDARLAESALCAVAAEVSEQGLINACSTEPRLQPTVGPRQKRPRRQLAGTASLAPSAANRITSA